MTIQSRSFTAVLLVLTFGGFNSIANAQQLVGEIIDIDFEGGTAANPALGPDGVLVGDATVSGGVLILTPDPNGVEGPGLDIPFVGDPNAPTQSPFAGNLGFYLSFEFNASEGSAGPLFQAFGDVENFDDDPPEATGSITVWLNSDGEIQSDLWFVDGDGGYGGLNDGEWHTLELDFDAASGALTITADFDEEGSFTFGFEPFERPATAADTVRFGDALLNLDLEEDVSVFGEDPDALTPCDCMFDNIFAESFPPPPPAALNLLLDAETGEVFIVGTATTDAIDSFTITAPFGNFDPNAYTGVAGVLDLSGNGDFDANENWLVVSNTGDGVSESDDPNNGPNDGAVITDLQQHQVGGAGFWKAFPITELEVTATLTTGETTAFGELTVVGDLPLVGDLIADDPNSGSGPDGDVDIFDYLRLVKVFNDDIEELSGFDAYFAGDLDGSGFKNLEDFITFRNAYDEFNGLGAFVAMVASISVPEPSSLLLFAGCGLALGFVRRRRRGMLLLVAVLALGIGVDSTYAADIFDYQFTTAGSDFSNSSGPTGAATANIAGFTPPTTLGGKLVLPGGLLEILDVPLTGANNTIFNGASDFTLSLDFTSTGNVFQALPEPPGIVLFASVDPNDPEQSFSIYLDPEGSLAVEFVGSEGFVECFGCGLLDGVEHSVEVIYVAPEEAEEPGSLALKVDGSFVDVNLETFVELAGASFLTSIGGHRQREFTDEAFPTECFDGECFTVETEGTMDNVKLTDAAVTPTILRMEADRGTGEVTIFGGDFVREIVVIEIGSEFEGALVPENWNSFSDQNLDPVGTGPGETWEELRNDDFILVEAFLLGSSVLDPNFEISVGNIYNVQTQAEFLEAFVGAIHPITGEIENIFVEVELVGRAPGDFNEDFVSDGLDFLAWQRGESPNPLSAEDLAEWEANYGITGVPAALVSAVATVPEPTSFVLLAIAILGISRRYKPHRT